MTELFCKVNPFILKQQIYRVDTDTKTTKLIDQCFFGDLEDTLIALAQQEQIFNFHLHGEEHFIKEVGESLQAKYQLKYSNININIIYN